MEVVGASPTLTSAWSPTRRRAPGLVVSIDDEEINEDGEESTAVVELKKFIEATRRRNADVPIFLFGETRTSQHLPNEILKEPHGFIHMFEDTPEFTARMIVRESTKYLNALPPPFFKELVDYARDGSYSWHCPVTGWGGVSEESQWDQCSTSSLARTCCVLTCAMRWKSWASLLDHTGPVAASERNAARIFGADHLFFVTNGTSTSNKVVGTPTWRAMIIVLVDRNCHKSILHAIMMTGTVPIFLQPTRNHLIIGPITRDQFRANRSRKDQRTSAGQGQESRPRG